MSIFDFWKKSSIFLNERQKANSLTFCRKISSDRQIWPNRHWDRVEWIQEMTPGRKVRRSTKIGKKKVCFFRPVDFFKVGNFQIWNLIKSSLFAVLTCKICNFLLDMINLRIPNSLFQKTTARKIQTFFFAGKLAHLPTGRQMVFNTYHHTRTCLDEKIEID